MAAEETEWDFYQTGIEGQPATIALDLALADDAPFADKPWMLWVSLKIQNSTEDGFPTDDEAETLGIIEDLIAGHLDVIDATHAGRIISGGLQDLYFYSPTNDEFEDIVLEVMEGYPEYEFATDAKKDPEWNEYLGNLYPDYYDFQCMLNRRVTDTLQEQGDNGEAQRPIDHLIYFQEDKGRQSFAKEIENLGYQIVSAGPMEKNASLPYPLNIVRDDTAVPSAINKTIWKLCELAGKYKGHYDSWGCDSVQ